MSRNIIFVVRDIFFVNSQLYFVHGIQKSWLKIIIEKPLLYRLDLFLLDYAVLHLAMSTFVLVSL